MFREEVQRAIAEESQKGLADLGGIHIGSAGGQLRVNSKPGSKNAHKHAQFDVVARVFNADDKHWGACCYCRSLGVRGVMGGGRQGGLRKYFSDNKASSFKLLRITLREQKECEPVCGARAVEYVRWFVRECLRIRRQAVNSDRERVWTIKDFSYSQDDFLARVEAQMKKWEDGRERNRLKLNVALGH